MHIIFPKAPDITEKVRLMQQDAAYDVADADISSIRREIRSRAALPKVPKVFLSNDCIFNCAYCGCRETNECKQYYAASPRELAEISYKQARQGRNGIFLSSAILNSPDYTQELLIRTMRILREEIRYKGYIHSKVMPGTDAELIRQSGLYADRLSVNIEVAHSEGYGMVAHNKNKQNILTPMGQISRLIESARADKSIHRPHFATSQTTQLMAGSTGEDDFTILNLSRALYQKYGLIRVYYTAFEYTWHAIGYDRLPQVVTPPWRMHRLYQADRLMQLYGFTPEELLPGQTRRLSPDLDPKAAWALRNMDFFPVEINHAAYEQLLRVPGIGIICAQRIVQARRHGTLTHDALRKLGVSINRCAPFITCNGRMAGAPTERVQQLSLLLSDPFTQAAGL